MGANAPKNGGNRPQIPTLPLIAWLHASLYLKDPLRLPSEMYGR